MSQRIYASSPKFRYYVQSLQTPLILGLLCFFVYNANFRQIGSGDTIPARYLPLIMWRSGAVDFDANARLVAHGHSMIPARNRPSEANGKVAYFEPWAYWMIIARQNQKASLYPIVTPLLVAPLYLPAVIWLNAHGWEQPAVDRVAEIMEKISASFLASLVSVLMFLILRRNNTKWSLPLALAFAFGTNTWMISSQALWQHGAGELLITLGLLLVISDSSPMRIALLGAVCVLMAGNRPPDALIAGAIVLFTVWSRRRQALWLIAGAIIPLMLLIYYNLYFIGHFAGAYALAKPPDNFFQPGLSGIAGLLVSPTRGLLIFTPFLIFLPFGLIKRFQTQESKILAAALSLAVAVQFLVYSQTDWRAGVSWGPRWLTDILPILMWMLAPAPLIMGPIWRKIFILTITAAVLVQIIGAFWYTKISDERIFGESPTSMSGAWNPRNTPFLIELRQSRAKAELQCNATATLDRINSIPITDDGEIPELKNGSALEGWSLACQRTPAQLLLLVDGILVGSTGNFLPRDDVDTNSPTGWRIEANTQGITSGEHILQMAVRVEPRSDIRIVREQQVMVVGEKSVSNPPTLNSISDLGTMSARVTQLLQERQAQDGYWLTYHTKELKYENPQPEMNTFLTAMLVDYLSPIAKNRSLDDSLERAIRHLTAQIETNGLVRYHGLPDSPIIGKLGCIITPDADNTALSWRITGLGSKDPRFKQMLEELGHFRDPGGLFRTWLAEQKDYRCLDPGRDPNPADIVIQMHIYLMLRKFDPLAAQNLCKALQLSSKGEDVWVYYNKAPLLPNLRSAELKKLGCSFPMPVEHLRSSVEGQQIWDEVGEQFIKTMFLPPDAKTRKTIDELLVRLGSNDFALLRQTPPLLYHNDMSATVKRFYWSEDFGYALWLRLYEVSRGKDKQSDQSSR